MTGGFRQALDDPALRIPPRPRYGLLSSKLKSTSKDHMQLWKESSKRQKQTRNANWRSISHLTFRVSFKFSFQQPDACVSGIPNWEGTSFDQALVTLIPGHHQEKGIGSG